MLIPHSILEPFGVTGIPTLKSEWDYAETVIIALHDMVDDHRFAHMDPEGFVVLLRIHAIKAGAASAYADYQRFGDGEIIFKVTYQMTLNGPKYNVYPSYYPTEIS